MQNFFFHLISRPICEVLLKFLVVESSRYEESDENILVIEKIIFIFFILYGFLEGKTLCCEKFDENHR